MRIRFLILRLALLAVLGAYPLPALAQAPQVKVEALPVEYTFGKTINFRATVHAEVPFQEALVFFQAQGSTHTEVQPAAVTPQDATTYNLSYLYNLGERPLRAFSTITYRFKVTLQNGATYTSPDFSFFYEDNRFQWKVLEGKPFRVHWVEGDDAFGQSVLDVAQAGLQRVNSLVTLQAPGWVNIYIYTSSAQMQATLDTAGKSWIAGHADPDLGVMVAALPAGPDQRLLTEQRIPHELMHIMLYQTLGQGFANLPDWLNEGLASNAELYPNPDYQIILNSAYQKKSLLPINSLCQSLPRDVSSALLAYAESASFTRYLQRTYGMAAMQSVVQDYGNGLDCGRGLEAALGQSMPQLERQWRQDTFAENASLTAVNNLLPWAVMLVAVLGVPLLLAVSRLRRASLAEMASDALIE